MRTTLAKGLEATAALWPDVRVAFGRVHRAAAQGKSPFTVMAIRCADPLAGSTVCSQPSCSTISVPPPAARYFTSAFLNRVTCRTAFVPGS